MQRRLEKDFIDASEERQIQMLDLLSAQPAGEVEVSNLAPGREFFQWVARMTVDAFYTSPMGIRDIGFLGNKGMATYVVPAEALQHALRRSPFGNA
jgi:predicted Fe-Mo cluster-binding NifX family protein